MNIRLLILLSTFTATFTVTAQDLVTKIPAEAAAVLKIKTSQLTALLSADEFSKTEAGKKLLQIISRKKETELKNISELGINLQGNCYYFRLNKDSINYNCIILPIADAVKFGTLIKSQNGIVNNNNVWNTISDDSSSFMIWNKEYALLVNGTLNQSFFYSKEITERYGLSSSYNYTYPVYTDTTALPDVVDTISETTQTGEIETVVAPPAATDTDSSYIEEDTTYDGIYNDTYYKDSQIKKQLTAIWTDAFTKNLFIKNPQLSIASDNDYLRSVDENAAAVFWTKNPMGLYYSALPYYAPYSGSMSRILGTGGMANNYGYERIVAKVFTEEKQLRITTDIEMGKEYAELFSKIYKRKLNKNFFKYMNTDSLLGYMAWSLDTKTYLEEFPKLLESAYGNIGLGVNADELSLAGEFISLLLDEEAISNMIKGDAIILFNGISQHENTYTDYEYDDNFNSKEIQKTKKESIPDFTMMFSSEENTLIKKLISYGIKKETVKMNGVFYELSIPKSPFQLFFMQKNGIFFFTNSLPEVQKIADNSYQAKFSKKQIKELRTGNFTAFMHPQKIGTTLSSSGMEITEDFTKMINTFNKMGTVYIRTMPVKGSNLSAEMKMDVPEGNVNSLKYFFSIIDSYIK